MGLIDIRLVDIEGCSEELLRQQSYAIKNQHGSQLLCYKEPARSKQNTPIGALDAQAGSLWHKTAGASNTKKLSTIEIALM